MTFSGAFDSSSLARFSLLKGLGLDMYSTSGQDLETNTVKIITENVGPQLIGLILNWFLFGALTLQVYVYNQNFPKDPKKIKFLVYGLFLAETLQSILITNDVFHWVVYGWGNLNATEKIYTNWLDIPILGGCIAAIVQLFFAWRTWVLGRYIPLTVAIVVGALLQSSTGIAIGIKLLISGSLGDVRSLYLMAMVRLASSVVTDVIIASSMTYMLLRSRSKAFRSTNTVIRRLVQLTIETGSTTASFAIIALFLLKLSPDSTYYLTPSTALAKLYTNTLLVILNNRISIRRQGTNIANELTDTFAMYIQESDPVRMPQLHNRRGGDLEVMGDDARSNDAFADVFAPGKENKDIPFNNRPLPPPVNQALHVEISTVKTTVVEGP